MRDVAAESALIRNADTLERQVSHYTERALMDAARSELKTERSDGELLASIDSLMDRGFLHQSKQHDGYLYSDHGLLRSQTFAKALTDPTPTNPRVTPQQLLDGKRDLSNPMDQPQRYSIVDATARGGVEATLKQILSPEDRANAVFIHGERGPDIARFPIGNETLHNGRDWLTETRSTVRHKDAEATGYSQNTTLIISDAAVRAPHRAELYAETAEMIGAGKVIFLVEPDKTPLREMTPIATAIRTGAVSEVSVPSFFTDRPTQSVARDFENVRGAMTEVRSEPLELAAARLADDHARKTGEPVQLVASDPARQENLNIAARVISDARDRVEGRDARPSVTLDVLNRRDPEQYNPVTGGGIRPKSVMQITAAPESFAYKPGDRLMLGYIDPIDSRASVRDPDGMMYRLPLNEMAEQGVKFDIYSRTQATFREGDPASIATAKDGRVEGRIGDVGDKSFSLNTADGRRVDLTSETARAGDMRPALASNTPDFSKPGRIVMVAGSNDRAVDGAFAAGAVLAASRILGGSAERIDIVTDKTERLIESSERTSSRDVLAQQQAFERFLADTTAERSMPTRDEGR
ncbi:hypothetical protein [Maricaulis sp.]|uniref:hypothetical protein n=1 Tax=Maricaulis sp. TaxID=1486257 RepID=UPI002602DABE|nr:hypothetical protein [Maricaulis sp.]MDF1769448.1 hypothetical protein [Maricaulis sp.]